MKRIAVLFAIICLYHITVFGQKKYEMVIEKTDGTEIVINTEDIVRTYFRERTEEEKEEEKPDDDLLLGEFHECTPDGTLLDDASNYEVLHLKLYKDGTGEFWSVSKGKVDEFKYSFTYTSSFSGSSGTITQTITSCTNPIYIGMSLTASVTYINNILHSGEVYYKLINGQGLLSDNTPDDPNVPDDPNDPDDPAVPAGLDAVDLGLPSGTKWANMNIGANKPEELGGFYAWGETAEKNMYSYSTYIYAESETSYKNLGNDISGTQYDVASNKWGKTWRMPTYEQCKELVEKCSWVATSVNGIKGTQITGPSGNSIFLPAGGRKYSSKGHRDYGEVGCYWTSTSDHDVYAKNLLVFGSETDLTDSRNRANGMSIRPVSK